MKVETKASSADLVTETDKQVEELILSELKQKFPSHKYRASVSDNNTCSGCGHPQCGSLYIYNNYQSCFITITGPFLNSLSPVCEVYPLCHFYLIL